jgi:hypothetical protein
MRRGAGDRHLEARTKGAAAEVTPLDNCGQDVPAWALGHIQFGVWAALDADGLRRAWRADPIQHKPYRHLIPTLGGLDGLTSDGLRGPGQTSPKGNSGPGTRALGR